MKQSVSYFSLFIIVIQFTIMSCSKNPVKMGETVTAFPQFYSGVIYNYCDPSPQIHFSINSIRLYCSNSSLNDMFDADSLNQNNFKACTQPLGDENNWDFILTTGASGYELVWRETPVSVKPVQAKTVFEGGKYPYMQFYKGYEVKISENQALTMLFFNGYVGGCIHDYYIWELVDRQ